MEQIAAGTVNQLKRDISTPGLLLNEIASTGIS